MKTIETFRAELLQDAQTRREYDALGPEFAVARALIEARTRAGLTQSEVAARMGTTQSVIARLESGRAAPSLRSLERYARAVGGRVRVSIEAEA